MMTKVKLKRVDLRLKPESYPVNGETLNEPGKVVDYASDLLKSMRTGQVAILNLTAKGQVLRSIITTKKTISTLGPGMAAVLRESLLSNCMGVIAIEKAEKPEFVGRDEKFAETLIYAFKELSMEVLDYIKAGYGGAAYASFKAKEPDYDKFYQSGRKQASPNIKAGFHKTFEPVEASLELTEEGALPVRNTSLSITDAIDAVTEEMKFRNREHIYVIAIDRNNRPQSYSVVSVGTVNSSIANAGDVIRNLALQEADSFVVLHNHPSSNPEPSLQDDEVTARLVNAAGLTGIKMLDHIIVGGITGKYYSYAEEGRKEYGFTRWSDIAKDTKDDGLISWFAACQYTSVKLGLLLNPDIDRSVVEKLAVDKDKSVSKWAEEKLEKMDRDEPGIRGQIESIKTEMKVAEDRLSNYGKIMAK